MNEYTTRLIVELDLFRFVLLFINNRGSAYHLKRFNRLSGNFTHVLLHSSLLHSLELRFWHDNLDNSRIKAADDNSLHEIVHLGVHIIFGELCRV